MNKGRPQRPALKDFAGRNFSLPDNNESWQRLNPAHNEDGPLLVLGLGPKGLPAFASSAGTRWLESAPVLEALKTLSSFVLPDSSNALSPEQAIELAATSRIYFYRGAMRLAPDFWGEILAQIKTCPGLTGRSKKKLAWLPGQNSQLLHQELSQALASRQYEVADRICQDADEFLSIFADSLPSFALSINFRGLDGDGSVFHLLQALGIPLAIWLVDNPWHLLSAIPWPWWKKANIFITDASFVPDLIKIGAQNVWFCPLAVAPHMWREPKFTGKRPLFVGRSQFPGRDAFFGSTPPDSVLMRKAREMLNTSASPKPDYHWWSQNLNYPPWPGLAGRKAGHGAELCSSLNRALWLSQIPDIDLVGDDGWREILPGAHIIPPVDYYGKLPDLYNSSFCVLNVTSLLLPGSLNQRHFDVWAAGGVLISDQTSGLNIFPEELVKPITISFPQCLGDKFADIEVKQDYWQDLSHAWRECLTGEHLYWHRLDFIHKSLQLSIPE